MANISVFEVIPVNTEFVIQKNLPISMHHGYQREEVPDDDNGNNKHGPKVENGQSLW